MDMLKNFYIKQIMKSCENFPDKNGLYIYSTLVEGDSKLLLQ